MSTLHTVRGETVYVSYVTRKALRYISETLAEDDPTVDALAEKILADWVKANYPNVVDHMRSQYQIDQDFRKSLKSNAKVT